MLNIITANQTTIYHFIPTRISVIKNSKTMNVEKSEPLHTKGRNAKWYSCEKVWKFLKNLNTESAYDSAVHISTQKVVHKC